MQEEEILSRIMELLGCKCISIGWGVGGGNVEFNAYGKKLNKKLVKICIKKFKKIGYKVKITYYQPAF